MPSSPSPSPAPVVATLEDVEVTWPDGTPGLSSVSLSLPEGRSALVGANGAGKTTLLRVLAGELAPTRGRVHVTGAVEHLRQDLTWASAETVPAFLGVAPVLDALERLESGGLEAGELQDVLDVVGDAWDLAERTTATLARLGLPDDLLGRTLSELSGGEVVRLGLARALLARPDVLLLDEPTNNLDVAARAGVHEVVASWSGALLVVSHDRDLLELVDRVGELRDGTDGPRVTWYGGGWSDYRAQVAAEQEAAEQAVATARADVRRQRADQLEAERQLAGRRRVASKSYAEKREPRAVMKLRRRSAQESAGRLTGLHEDRVAAARERLDDAESRLRDDVEVRIDLPGTELARGTVVLETDDLVLRTGRPVDIALDGPERVAVVGPNGSGKSTLLHTLTGDLDPLAGTARIRVSHALLPQRYVVLDPDLSVAGNVRDRAPGSDENSVRARLARFGIRGAAADRPAGGLSGGERFRATLAALLLAEPPPRLLMLDEPTNNLDLAAYDALVSALGSFRGALLVAAHDERFLADIGIERRVELG